MLAPNKYHQNRVRLIEAWKSGRYTQIIGTNFNHMKGKYCFLGLTQKIGLCNHWSNAIYVLGLSANDFDDLWAKNDSGYSIEYLSNKLETLPQIEYNDNELGNATNVY
jgi:hypothetical protein